MNMTGSSRKDTQEAEMGEHSGFEDVPAIMSPAQLAEVLNVSVRSLERWRADGEGPEYRHPAGTRFYRYYRSDVLAWLENKMPVAATTGNNTNTLEGSHV